MDAAPESSGSPEGPTPHDRERVARRERAERQQERAAETIRSIASGGDVGSETLALANEYTDALVARIARRFGFGGAR